MVTIIDKFLIEKSLSRHETPSIKDRQLTSLINRLSKKGIDVDTNDSGVYLISPMEKAKTPILFPLEGQTITSDEVKKVGYLLKSNHAIPWGSSFKTKKGKSDGEYGTFEMQILDYCEETPKGLNLLDEEYNLKAGISCRLTFEGFYEGAKIVMHAAEVLKKFYQN